MLADSYGRVAADLRVSLTDRCNLRCAYCMPPEGLDWLPKPEVLTGDEIVRLITIGLDRINVSLDTLRPEVFRKLTHRDRLADVLAGLAAAASAGLTPVKVNAV